MGLNLQRYEMFFLAAISKRASAKKPKKITAPNKGDTMGNTYEISIYKKVDGEYGYESVWWGESRKEALKKMDEYAKQGIGCIKLEYRP